MLKRRKISCTVGLFMTSTFFPAKRALDSHQGFVADMKINLRGFRVTVSRQCLDILPFYALLHQMCCKAMPEGVGSCSHRKFSIRYSPAHHLFQCTDYQVITGELIREQDSPGPSLLKPVLCKDIQIPPGKNRIAIHPVLCIPDMDLHICAGNIIIMQMDDFGNAHSGRIHRCKHSFIFYVINSVQQTVDFINRQNSRKFVFRNHARDCNVIPKDVQDIPIEKANGRIIKVQGGGFQPFVLFCKKKSPDILTGKLLWVLVLIFQEIRDVVFISGNGMFFEVTDFSSLLKLF